jgi:hypothetical protein
MNKDFDNLISVEKKSLREDPNNHDILVDIIIFFRFAFAAAIINLRSGFTFWLWAHHASATPL